MSLRSERWDRMWFKNLDIRLKPPRNIQEQNGTNRGVAAERTELTQGNNKIKYLVHDGKRYEIFVSCDQKTRGYGVAPKYRIKSGDVKIGSDTLITMQKHLGTVVRFTNGDDHSLSNCIEVA
jgi:hypothetical protein